MSVLRAGMTRPTNALEATLQGADERVEVEPPSWSPASLAGQLHRRDRGHNGRISGPAGVLRSAEDVGSPADEVGDQR